MTKEAVLKQRSGRYEPQPGGYDAFIPAPLPPDRPITLDDAGQVLLSRADQALARLDGVGRVLPSLELFVAAFMKKEAVQSSQIEGTQTTLLDLFDYEAGAKPPAGPADMQEVTNYLEAMRYGLERLDDLPFASRLIRELHRILMTGVRGGARQPGEFRTEQVFIGPEGASIREARYIPPPPDAMLEAMASLERFLHDDTEMPVLVKCALIHYQFEAIHPFLDGNGRIGRMLITLYLCWTGVLSKPLLYLSYFLNKHGQEYRDRLGLASTRGDYEQWVRFFLQGILETASEATGTATKIIDLQKADGERVMVVKGASPLLLRLHNKLFATPVVSVSELRQDLQVSRQTATDLIAKLEKLGVLKETTGASRNRRYAYEDYIALIEPGPGLH